MLKKHKKSVKKLLPLGLACSVLVALGLIVHVATVSAAPARCMQTIVAGGTPTDCSTAPHFNIQGGSFMDNHCYQTTPFGSTTVWADVSCSKPPFNANFQSAACSDGTTQTGPKTDSKGKAVTTAQICKDHGGTVDVPITPPNQANYKPIKSDCKAASKDLNRSNCGIINYLVILIDAISALVGLVVVASIIVGGIQFTTAGNDPQKLAAAKGRIINALLAVAVFIFMFAFLQWIVPGGIF